MAITPQSTFEDYLKLLGYTQREDDDGGSYWMNPDPMAEGGRLRPGRLESMQEDFQRLITPDASGRLPFGSTGWVPGLGRSGDPNVSTVIIDGTPYIRTGEPESPSGYWVREWLQARGIPESEFGKVSFYHPEYGYVTNADLVNWQSAKYQQTKGGTMLDKFLDAGGGVFALAAPIAGAALGVGPLAGASTLAEAPLFGSLPGAASELAASAALEGTAATAGGLAPSAGSIAAGAAPVVDAVPSWLAPSGTANVAAAAPAAAAATTASPAASIASALGLTRPVTSSWVNIASGILDIFANRERANALEDIARQAATVSDPFAAQRPLYQGLLQRSMTDPEFFANNAVFQGLRRLAMEDVMRNMSARGYNMSGNEILALGSRLQDEGFRYAIPFQDLLSRLAGGYISPGDAGRLLMYGQSAAQDAQSNVWASVGSILGEIAKRFPDFSLV